MTKSDGPTIGIDPIEREANVANDSEGLCRKRFVKLYHIAVSSMFSGRKSFSIAGFG